MNANEPRDGVDPASALPLRSDLDLSLLARPELRPLRLQLDYLKPEIALVELGIEHTVVVFGSTRLNTPDDAARRLADAQRLCALDPDEPNCRDALLAAQRAAERSRYYEIAREFGRIVGRAGEGPKDNRLLLVTGGGPGAMEAANRGAHEVGALSCGLNIALPREQDPNPYITPELSFRFRYFALRKLHFMLRACALVAFPGGYGTLDELFEVLCLVQTGKRNPLPVVLVGGEFWNRAIDFDFLVETEMIAPGDLDLFVSAESAQGAWNAIADWYESRGSSALESILGATPDEVGTGLAIDASSRAATFRRDPQQENPKMHETELEQLVDCVDCGTTISIATDRGFAVGAERALCFECARRRGGEFDDVRDVWARSPETTDLPDHSEV